MNFSLTFSSSLKLLLELEDLEDLSLNHHLHFLQDQVTLEQETKTCGGFFGISVIGLSSFSLGGAFNSGKSVHMIGMLVELEMFSYVL